MFEGPKFSAEVDWRGWPGGGAGADAKSQGCAAIAATTKVFESAVLESERPGAKLQQAVYATCDLMQASCGSGCVGVEGLVFVQVETQACRERACGVCYRFRGVPLRGYC